MVQMFAAQFRSKQSALPEDFILISGFLTGRGFHELCNRSGWFPPPRAGWDRFMRERRGWRCCDGCGKLLFQLLPSVISLERGSGSGYVLAWLIKYFVRTVFTFERVQFEVLGDGSLAWWD